MNIQNGSKPGQILIISIILFVAVSILGLSLFKQSGLLMQLTSKSHEKELAIQVAEAGIESALWQLNQTAGAYTGETGTPVGTTGVYDIQITNKTPTVKTIISTGYIPSAANPKTKQKITVDAALDNTIISFRYAVQVGTGGLTMGAASTINGNVYSNEKITGMPGSIIDGEAWAVGTISPLFPIITGSSHPLASPQPLPDIDAAPFITAAKAGGTTNLPADCNPPIGAIRDVGPKKYDCDLNIASSANLTLKGPVYVTGDLRLSTAAHITLDESFGSNSTAIVVNGTVTLETGSFINPTSANPKGYVMLLSQSASPSAITLLTGGSNAILYTLSGGARVGTGARSTAITANKLTLDTGAALDYDTGLASTSFSTGPGGSWQIKKGTYQYKSP